MATIEEYKQTLHAFEALKRHDEAAFLEDIAHTLRPYYEDLKASESDPVDAELGAMYRETLKSVFKALQRKGIPL